MSLKYFIIVFIGFICVLECQGAELSRWRRDGGMNVIEILLKVEQLLNSCQKTSAAPANNQTNPVQHFIESHDIQCLVEGFIKMFKEISNNNHNTRRKRDTANLITQFLQLQEDIAKCKNPDAHPSNSTNMVEQILNKYDVVCLAKTLVEFIKTVTSSNNETQRRKRAIELSDITCFMMKVLDEESKIQQIIKAYSEKEVKPRSKRAASTQQICDDFGSAVDGLLKLILDFAPNQTS